MSDPPVRPDDPRMRGFRARVAVEEALAAFLAPIAHLDPETVGISKASGRVLTAEIRAGDPVPQFDRAAMDGYAVRGEETFGATDYCPAEFRLVGVARPGQASPRGVGPGEAVEIATGAPLPDGADTVVRVEVTARHGAVIAVTEATPPGRHVGHRGEDLAAGALALRPGRALRPQDLGVLSALGLPAVPVVRRPLVTIVITGDELLAPGSPPTGCRIADSNSVMLAALVERDGGVAEVLGPIADDREQVREVLRQVAARSDLVLVSGGSSTGPEDHAPGVVAGLGRLVAHGIALRPASPTGLGFMGAVPVALLPGNPVSCLCAYDFFAGPAVRRLGGRALAWPYRAAPGVLGHKLVSVLGRVDYARVRLEGGRVEPLAISGASILSSTTRADGFVVVPADLEGYPEGAGVTVWLYDLLQPTDSESAG